MQHEPIVLGCNCCYTRGTASYVFGAADVPETKGWTSTTTEIGPLNRLYMPGASYNDTCPVFLRLSQSIPHRNICLSHYYTARRSYRMRIAATMFAQDRPPMPPLATLLKYPLLGFFVCKSLVPLPAERTKLDENISPPLASVSNVSVLNFVLLNFDRQ